MQQTTPRSGRESIKERSALTVPSSALTGCPRSSTIDLGSAKNERYKSHGTSAMSSGAGIAAPYASRAACVGARLFGCDLAPCLDGRDRRSRRLRAALGGGRGRDGGRRRFSRGRRCARGDAGGRRAPACVGLGGDGGAVLHAEERPRAAQAEAGLQ